MRHSSMLRLDFSSMIEATSSQVFDWHMRPGAFSRLAPPWVPVHLIRHDGIYEGSQAELRIGIGLLGVTWVAEHTHVWIDRGFRDIQIAGPFSEWRHVHHFVRHDDNTSFLRDRIICRLPWWGVSHPILGRIVRSSFERQFAFRHRQTQRDLWVHTMYPHRGRSFCISGDEKSTMEYAVAFFLSGGWRKEENPMQATVHLDLRKDQTSLHVGLRSFSWLQKTWVVPPIGRRSYILADDLLIAAAVSVDAFADPSGGHHIDNCWLAYLAAPHGGSAPVKTPLARDWTVQMKRPLDRRLSEYHFRSKGAFARVNP